jgi:hypothetical protein
MPRSEKRGSIHPFPIRLSGVVLNELSTGIILPFFTIRGYSLWSKLLTVLLNKLYMN